MEYRLYEPPIRGGMAQVWCAEVVRAGGARRVAVKRIREDLAHDAAVRAMFDDEVRVTRGLAHPNIVGFVAHGEDHAGPWLALEWVEGASVHELTVARRAALPAGAAVAVALDLLRGLAAVHGPRSGVIHRDVSPANVLVDEHGVARLADFGVARALARARAHRPGTARGKIAYLPPEVLGGALHGVRGDLYGAGAVLWEALAGRKLFAHLADPAARAHAYLKSRRPPLRSVAPGVPAALAALVDRALALDPARRPASAEAMAAALDAAARASGIAPAPHEAARLVREVCAARAPHHVLRAGAATRRLRPAAPAA